MTVVEREIQFQDIDDGFAEKPELTAFRVRVQELSHNCVADAAFTGHALHLKRGRCG